MLEATVTLKNGKTVGIVAEDHVRQERQAIQQEDQSGYIQVDEEELPF